MANIKDVARVAGVSAATVSRVLNKPDSVKEKTKKKVLTAISELGYTPNNLASNLRRLKTNNILVVMPDVISYCNYGVVRGMERLAYANNYNILLGDTQHQSVIEKSYANMAKTKQIDGMILLCSTLPFELKPNLPISTQLPPLVNASEDVKIVGIPRVGIDNQQAAIDAVNYLISLGHKKIAVITGNSFSPSSIDRLSGYYMALQRAGISVNESWIESGYYSQQEAENACIKLMGLKDAPTALFCFSDEMAISSMSALLRLGLSIPRDISVMGFDNISQSNYCYPSLTTISQPMEEIGNACMELLLPQLSGEGMNGVHVKLKHSIVVRQSTGPLGDRSL